MGSDRNVVILADDIDILVSRMRNNMDLRIAKTKVWHDIAHREVATAAVQRTVLIGSFSRWRMAVSASSWISTISLTLLQVVDRAGFTRLTQHQHGVAIEFFAGICHSEPP